MDSFPVDFNLEAIQKQHLDQTTAYGLGQQAMLKAERKRVYDKITQDSQSGAAMSVIELPDTLCVEMKKQMAIELCERFPGHVEFRRVVEYADYDAFELIKDEKNPPVSFDYRVRFK